MPSPLTSPAGATAVPSRAPAGRRTGAGPRRMRRSSVPDGGISAAAARSAGPSAAPSSAIASIQRGPSIAVSTNARRAVSRLSAHEPMRDRSGVDSEASKYPTDRNRRRGRAARGRLAGWPAIVGVAALVVAGCGESSPGPQGARIGCLARFGYRIRASIRRRPACRRRSTASGASRRSPGPRPRWRCPARASGWGERARRREHA